MYVYKCLRGIHGRVDELDKHNGRSVWRRGRADRCTSVVWWRRLCAVYNGNACECGGGGRRRFGSRCRWRLWSDVGVVSAVRGGDKGRRFDLDKRSLTATLVLMMMMLLIMVVAVIVVVVELQPLLVLVSAQRAVVQQVQVAHAACQIRIGGLLRLRRAHLDVHCALIDTVVVAFDGSYGAFVVIIVVVVVFVHIRVDDGVGDYRAVECCHRHCGLVVVAAAVAVVVVFINNRQR